MTIIVQQTIGGRTYALSDTPTKWPTCCACALMRLPASGGIQCLYDSTCRRHIVDDRNDCTVHGYWVELPHADKGE